MKAWLSAFLLWTVSVSVQAQSQASLEYQLHHPFANIYRMETDITYIQLLADPPWRTLQCEVNLDRAFAAWVDVRVGLGVYSTVQGDTISTLEFRPMVGAKFHFTPNSRILTRLFLRLERREFKNIDETGWHASNRTRLRLEALIPLNKPTMFAGDNLWYGITDAEWFIVMDQEVQERYANRIRFRAGIGHRISYNWRLEGIYTYQESRAKFHDDTDVDNNIFTFVLKHYINKSKAPTNLDGK